MIDILLSALRKVHTSDFKFRGVDRHFFGKYISCELSNLRRKSAVCPLDKIFPADQAAN